jgi:rod shape determining protein RodA
MQSFTGKAQAFVVIGLPLLLVLIQNDTGSTLVYLSFLLVLFRAGLPSGVFIIGLILIALSIAALMVDKIWGIFHILLIIGNFTLLRFWKKDDRLSMGFSVLALLSLYFSGTQMFLTIALQLGLLVLVSALNLLKRNWQITVLTFGGIAVAMLYSSSVNYLVNNILKIHQQERIWVWLRPEKCDPLGSLYNLEQSKYAIGSGGFLGKGFLEGERTKLDYVPEQSTDFIFCTVGEEWGFLGSIILLVLFMTLLLRILYIAERQRLSFAKYYAYSVAAILLFHIFVNMGMTMGLLPVIGIPLPFISYGGSSMISFSLMMSILIKLDSERSTAFR